MQDAWLQYEVEAGDLFERLRLDTSEGEHDKDHRSEHSDHDAPSLNFRGSVVGSRFKERPHLHRGESGHKDSKSLMG